MSADGSKYNMTLKGKVTLITGAASGIGDEIAHVYAANGAKVAMIDFDRDCRRWW